MQRSYSALSKQNNIVRRKTQPYDFKGKKGGGRAIEICLVSEVAFSQITYKIYIRIMLLTPSKSMKPTVIAKIKDASRH